MRVNCMLLQTVKELQVYKGHTNVVEDVCWHQFNPHIFGSVGDDKQLILWDTREPPNEGEQAVEPCGMISCPAQHSCAGLVLLLPPQQADACASAVALAS